MTTTINASPSNGLVQTADGSGILKVQSNGKTTNAIAWVNFDGTTSPGTIRSQYNISSITKLGTGNYRVNFTNALSDSNYCAIVTTAIDGTQGVSGAVKLGQLQNTGVTTTTSCDLCCNTTNTWVGTDCATMCFAVFGN